MIHTQALSGVVVERKFYPMRRFSSGLSLSLSLLLLTACSGLQPRGGDRADVPAADSAVPAALPFEAPEPTVKELDADIVFSTLVGEIAAQRGELEQAYRYQLQTAFLADDAVAAERATRIALAMKRNDLALNGVSRWVTLAPNSIPARQLAALIYLRVKQPGRALRQLRALLKISDAMGRDGYLAAMAAMAKTDLPLRERAHSIMTHLVAGREDDPRAGYALSLLSLMWKAYPEAEQAAREVIKRHPDWNRAYVLLSRVRAAQGDKAGARQVLEKAIARNPDDLPLNAALARLLVQAGDYEQAYRQFRRVRELAPGETQVLYSLGVLALQLERPGAARGYFQQLSELGQRVDDAAFYLGQIELQAGHREKALAWFKKVRKGGFRFDAQVLVAQILAEQGKLDQAHDWFQSLRLKKPDEAVRLYLIEGELLGKHATSDRVLALYDQALQDHPDNEELLYSRGLYAANIGRLDILERDLRRVIEMDPDNADALNALGYTLVDKTKRYAEAQQLIARALALRPDSPAILDSMGWLQFRLGNIEQALQYLKKAFSKLPDPEIGAHLGEVLWVMGRQEEARKLWQQELEKDPQNEYLRNTMQRLQRP